MLDFNSTLNEVLGERKPGEQREVIIRYAKGRENEARVTMGTSGKNAEAEDAFALMYAVGKLLEKVTGLDGTRIGNSLVVGVTKGMMRMVLEDWLHE